MIASLHNHTKRSDGELSPKDFFTEAHSCGIQCIGFTDHDALLTDKDVQEITAEQEKQGAKATHWVSGIEMSASLRSHRNASVHLVGLFVDWNNKDLIAHCMKLQAACRSRMQKIVANLERLGFTIKEEECLAVAGREGNVRRPHIVKALSMKPSANDPVVRALVNKAVGDPAVAERAKALLGKCPPLPGSIDYSILYPLIFSDDALIPNVYVDYEYTLSVEESADLIRRAGGICLFPHYYLYKDLLSLGELRDMVKSGVVDGVETIFERRENYDEMVSLTKELHCLPGGGGDIHEKEQIKGFYELQGELSKGVTESILLSGKVSLNSIRKFSSLLSYYMALTGKKKKVN